MHIVFWKNADTISVLTVTYSFDTVHERNIQQDGQTDRQTPYDGIGRACAWHREANKSSASAEVADRNVTWYVL